MNKRDFLKKLSKALHTMQRDERKKSLVYYEELISDNMENGLTEEEAVAKCGNIGTIADDILSDACMSAAIKQKGRAVNTALLIAGAPLWIALVCVVIAVLIVVYAAIWVVMIALFAVLIALFAAGLAGMAAFVLQLVNGFPATAFMALGTGLISAALVLLLYNPVIKLAKCILKATVVIWKKTWAMVLKKGGRNA